MNGKRKSRLSPTASILEILLLLARDLEKRKGTLDALSFNGFLERMLLELGGQLLKFS